MRGRRHQQSGMTLVEALLAAAIAALLLAPLVGIMTQAFRVESVSQARNDRLRQARFAMDEMVRVVAATPGLLLPLADKPGTTWQEHVREETVPPSPPEPGSSLASAVLAVLLPLESDVNGDGVADSDNDGDGRIDEDPGADVHNDAAAGIFGIDDAGNGVVDDSAVDDDDEYLSDVDEDPVNGVDDDADGNVDEDPAADHNGDGAPGFANVDDDGDGTVDEGSAADDDEDGQTDEDWLDPVVFYLSGDTLRVRRPVPWDADTSGTLTGRDVVEETLAEGVVRFRVERIAGGGDRHQLVDLVLELGLDPGEPVRVHARVRVGAAP